MTVHTLRISHCRKAVPGGGTPSAPSSWASKHTLSLCRNSAQAAFSAGFLKDAWRAWRQCGAAQD